MTKSTKSRFTVRPTFYRAWDGKKMVTVQSLCWNAMGAIWYASGNQHGWAWINPDFNGWTDENLKPSENDICPIMQFTGLFDKKGKEIWEGDIVRARENWLISVHEEPRWHIGVVNFTGTGIQIETKSERNVVFEDCQVVGNFFQNPELLET